MKSNKLVTVTVIIVGILAAALSVGAASAETPTFEYMVQSHVGLSELNKLGAEGWELVAVTNVTDSGRSIMDTAYLKRLKR